jgi:hypothetical protein
VTKPGPCASAAPFPYISYWSLCDFDSDAAQIKEFNADKINAAVLQMMDYDPTHVELFPGRGHMQTVRCTFSFSDKFGSPD